MLIEEVLKYAYAVVRRLSRDDEYLSVAHVAVVHALDTWTLDTPFLPYVGTVVRNAVLTAMRGERLRRCGGEVDVAAPRHVPDVAELVERLGDELARWYWVDRVPVKKIALRLGVAPITVYKRLERVRVDLWRLYEDSVEALHEDCDSVYSLRTCAPLPRGDRVRRCA